MNKLNVFLEQLDLSEIEASLYTGLLDNGPMSVRDLAVFTKMKRTTAYFYIDQLVEKGLVVKLSHGTQKLVTVSQPKESLQYLVEEKERQAKQLKGVFPDMLTAIKTTLPKIKTNTEAEIKYYKGKNGVKKIYEETLKGKEVRSYVNAEEIAKAFPDNYQLLDIAYDSNPEIKIFEICEESPTTRKRLLNPQKNHLYKVLPKNKKLTSQDVLISDDKIAIIDLKGSTNGIVITSVDLAKNFRLLFDLLWDVLPD